MGVDSLSWEKGGLGDGHPDHMKRSGWVAVGLNTYRKVNLTSTLGATQGIYDGLLFGLGNKEYKIMKVNEDFHVTPHAQNPFYQNAKAQRGELERIISTTLNDIGNEVGQWQLLQHDVRKAEEMLNYYTSDDEAALKTIFVDQVDYYTGGGGGQGEGRLSMAFMRKSNIMPTIVEDFLSMANLDDLAEGGSLGKLPQVEKNFLKAKWAAFAQWKNLFKDGIDERYRTVKSLCNSKERFIAERRNWLKPHVMQHKMLNNSLSTEGGRAGQNNNFFDRPGESRSFTNQTVWLWKPIRTRHNIDRVPDEMYQNPRYLGKNAKYGVVKAYDYHVQEKFIYNADSNKGGFVGRYNWITEKQIEAYVEGLTHMSDAQHKFDHHGKLDENEWYYTVFTIDFEKIIFNVMANGSPTPFEDGTWTIHGYIVTKNMLLMKLLERTCEDEKIEIEMNDIINMDTDKYYLKYHCTKEFGSYMMTKENMVYAHKKKILKGKDFKAADENGKLDVDGKKYVESDFILFAEDDLKKLEEDGGAGGLSFDKAGNLLIPGSYYDGGVRKIRDVALDVLKKIVQKKIRKFNDHSDIVLQRVSAPVKNESKFVKTTKGFFKNFGVDFKWKVEDGPYQSEMLDALTQGTFKLAGSTFWGPEIIGPLYSSFNIPW
ncbi:MAG: hypothetical protein K0B07_05040 [DPANN group archaeon]|nr:hypothetical protein [DPANN group archaeon]